jgi:hypothetical protein
MTISAKIILDSISPLGVRLTTFQLRYPRFIHAEELTHRILDTQPELLFYEAIPDGLMYDQNLSRNASSSRAIPVKRLIEDLRRDPAMPIYWGRNKPGMQAGEDWNALVSVPTTSGGIWDRTREQAWLDLMEVSIEYAEAFDASEYHKQIVNRLLEPWAHINVVVTAVQWGNFFALRSHPDAQPEIKLLSDQMQSAMHCSTPSLIENGQWHLPYVLGSDWEAIRAFAKKNRVTRDEPQYEELSELALMVSVARCARVSYKTHDGRETTVEEDIELANKLVVATPLHASPAEHQAMPDTTSRPEWDVNKTLTESHFEWENPQLHGNLKGWKQHRKMLPNEFIAG